jgi:hypothetical protein
MVWAASPLTTRQIQTCQLLLGIYRSTNATSAANTVAFTKLTVNTRGGFAKGDTEVTDIAMEPGNANDLVCWRAQR